MKKQHDMLTDGKTTQHTNYVQTGGGGKKKIGGNNSNKMWDFKDMIKDADSD